MVRVAVEWGMQRRFLGPLFVVVLSSALAEPAAACDWVARRHVLFADREGTINEWDQILESPAGGVWWVLRRRAAAALLEDPETGDLTVGEVVHRSAGMFGIRVPDLAAGSHRRIVLFDGEQVGSIEGTVIEGTVPSESNLPDVKPHEAKLLKYRETQGCVFVEPVLDVDEAVAEFSLDRVPDLLRVRVEVWNAPSGDEIFVGESPQVVDFGWYSQVARETRTTITVGTSQVGRRTVYLRFLDTLTGASTPVVSVDLPEVEEPRPAGFAWGGWGCQQSDVAPMGWLGLIVVLMARHRRRRMKGCS